MSLVVVMRFLTLGSTLSMPNQPPKIISTGNAFLTSKNDFQIPPTWVFLNISLAECVFRCVRVATLFWPCSADCGLDVTKWHRTPQRIISFECCEGKRSTSRWPIFFPQPVLCFYSVRRGSHKRVMGGREEGRRGREGRVRWAAAKEKNT